MPPRSDEIDQTDHRNLYGYTNTYDRDDRLAGRNLHSVIGLGTRIDVADLGLRRAAQRRKQ